MSDPGSQGDTPPSQPQWATARPWRWARMGRWRAMGRLALRKGGWDSVGQFVAAALVAAIFAGSLWVIGQELRGFEYAEVGHYLTGLPPSYVGTALILTFATFVVLAGYDALALRYIDVNLSGPRIALSAFIGYAVSQAVGNPILTGGSVRYRLYSLWGLAPADVAKAIGFAGASFWLGFFSLGGVVFLLDPVGLGASMELGVSSTALGTACLLPVVGYVGFTWWREAPLTVWGTRLAVPPQWMLPVQVGLAAGDLLLASSVVYVLLPPEVGVSFPHVLAVYLVALLAGLVSHVPGGLGVFEGTMLLLLAPPIEPPTLLGALLAYRGVFHLLPLVLALLIFGGFEVRRSMTGEV